jgi:hypothetical protein
LSRLASKVNASLGAMPLRGESLPSIGQRRGPRRGESLQPVLAPDVAGRDGGLEHISGGIDLETQT